MTLIAPKTGGELGWGVSHGDTEVLVMTEEREG